MKLAQPIRLITCQPAKVENYSVRFSMNKRNVSDFSAFWAFSCKKRKSPLHVKALARERCALVPEPRFPVDRCGFAPPARPPAHFSGTARLRTRILEPVRKPASESWTRRPSHQRILAGGCISSGAMRPKAAHKGTKEANPSALGRSAKGT